jgi:hypothetical protein
VPFTEVEPLFSQEGLIFAFMDLTSDLPTEEDLPMATLFGDTGGTLSGTQKGKHQEGGNDILTGGDNSSIFGDVRNELFGDARQMSDSAQAVTTS